MGSNDVCKIFMVLTTSRVAGGVSRFGQNIAIALVHSMQHSGRVVELLLVGENPAEARIAREALTRGQSLRHVTVASTSDEAMQILRREPPAFTNAPRPDLILLHLAQPYTNGRGLLEGIKGDPTLRRIPVMVLGDSQTDELQRAYNHHANCYIRKPASADELLRVIESIEQFWLGVVTLPPR